MVAGKLVKTIVSKKDINEGKRNMLLTTDDRCNYMCGINPEPAGNCEIIADNTQIIMRDDKLDYSLVSEEEQTKKICEEEIEIPDLSNYSKTDKLHNPEIKKKVEDPRTCLSFMTVKSVDEGIEWYKKHDPKIPEDLLPLMARWNWGDLSKQNKHTVKKESKREKAKLRKKEGLITVKKNVVLTFD